MEEGVPGARVIIADCPSQHYLPSLLRSTQFQQPETGAAGGATCVVHLTPAEVNLLTTRLYKQSKATPIVMQLEYPCSALLSMCSLTWQSWSIAQTCL